MIFAPRSITHSSSLMASLTIGSVITGVGKIRFSKLNVQCSCIHWLSAWMTTWVPLGSIGIRSSKTLANVGHMRARSSPSSSMRARRGSGSKNASGERIGSPMSSRRDFSSGFPFLKNSSEAPGRPTTEKVGFGMYSEITLRMAILSRPFTWTNLTMPSYSFGRNFVKASVRSYMWLSASNTGKSTVVLGIRTSWTGRPRRSAPCLRSEARTQALILTSTSRVAGRPTGCTAGGRRLEEEGNRPSPQLTKAPETRRSVPRLALARAPAVRPVSRGTRPTAPSVLTTRPAPRPRPAVGGA